MCFLLHMRTTANLILTSGPQKKVSTIPAAGRVPTNSKMSTSNKNELRSFLPGPWSVEQVNVRLTLLNLSVRSNQRGFLRQTVLTRSLVTHGQQWQARDAVPKSLLTCLVIRHCPGLISRFTRFFHLLYKTSQLWAPSLTGCRRYFTFCKFPLSASWFSQYFGPFIYTQIVEE